MTLHESLMSENKPQKNKFTKHGVSQLNCLKIKGQFKICHVLGFLMVQKLQPNDNQMIGRQNKSKGTNNVFFSHFQIGRTILFD
jgi:hypothetical protein